MIKANELRIGNLTMQGVVAEIDKDSFRVLNENNESLKSTWFEIEPIPLTEEWLIKLGFKKYIDFLNIAYIYDLTPLCGFTYDIETKRVTILENGNSMSHWIERKIEYVHELQNLYFALRWQELTPLH